MKTIFLNPPFKTEYGRFSRESRSPAVGHSGVLYYPLWLIYCASLLDQKGFDIDLYDACALGTGTPGTLDWFQQLPEHPGLIVIDTSTPSIISDCAFADDLRRLFPDTFIVLVGTHPSALPDETLRNAHSVDAVAVGEYDNTILKLAEALTTAYDQKNPLSCTDKTSVLCDIDGLVFRGNDETVIHNRPAVQITDLDSIPFASSFIRDHLDYHNYLFPAALYPSIQIFTGRGCPGRCSFCVYPQVMHGRCYRKRSTDSIIAEFREIVDTQPWIKEIVIEDDCFTADKIRLKSFCDKMIDADLSRRISWICNVRADLDLDSMRLMHKAGCRLIIVGIESYDQNLLNLMHKGTTISQIDRFMANSKKASLLVHACYMFGNRGETMSTMEKTLKAALRFKTDTAQFYPLCPYPGTESYTFAKENGLITASDYSDYCADDGTISCVIRTADISSEDLVAFCAYSRKRYYLRPWYILHRLRVGLTDPEDLKRSLKAFKRLSATIFKSASDPFSHENKA